MKLVVGLGNPGERYAHTRHNLGFSTVEALAAVLGSPDWQDKRSEPPYRMTLLGKSPDGTAWMAMEPQTFMNESGRAVSAYVRMAKIAPADLWVVHDDVDLPEGELRPVYNAGSAGHRGVESIVTALGTKAFNRLRIGIGRSDNPNLPTDAFVLEQADPAKLNELAALAAKFLHESMETHR